jgi:hypothetical protein
MMNIELQHVNVKLFLRNAEGLKTGDYTGVFNGWIQTRALGELLVDVADYGHVHHGPGLVLIGHTANYSLDESEGRLGLLYNRKARVDGSNQDRLRQAVRAALLAAQKLEREQGLQFEGGEVQIIVNDRHVAPNMPATFAALKPEFTRLFDVLYGGAAYSLANASRDPRERFSVRATTAAGLDLTALLGHLEAETAHAYAR